MEASYETVYIVEDWYDGPRSGYANYQGKPHFYQSLFLDTVREDDYDPNEDRFEMTPVPSQAVEWAVASNSLWLKWDEAHWAGRMAQEPNKGPRVLPEDLPRYQELCALIEQSGTQPSAPSFVVRGRFGPGSRKVQWFDSGQPIPTDC